jgi:hypothetical protein
VKEDLLVKPREYDLGLLAEKGLDWPPTRRQRHEDTPMKPDHITRVHLAIQLHAPPHLPLAGSIRDDPLVDTAFDDDDLDFGVASREVVWI